LWKAAQAFIILSNVLRSSQLLAARNNYLF
jgi:hypothetical protein